MSAIVIDGPTRDKLLAANGEVELRDEAGHLIGVFRKSPTGGPYAQEGDWPSDEELDRRTRESPRHSVDQVMARLHTLEEGLK